MSDDVARGPKGERGEPGPGMPAGVVRGFVFLSLLALLLAGASSWVSVRAVRGEISSRASVTQLCQAGNESRAQQITLWTHLVAISATPPRETPAARARRETLTREFLAYVRKVFAPRDCGRG
ncbi:MAG TPA: hypothetical protein VFQ68_44115 [Streptosporangiaceae bacterium]|nr:hypothetical protein [Streptosporangiaceae bacterium]